METRKSTTAGVVNWTPAPVRTSTTSSAISEDVWSDDDEEQVEKDDDFVSQMDENGIIGLSEALKGVELGQTCGAEDAGCNSNLYCGRLTPKEADPSGHKKDTPPDELSYTLAENLFQTPFDEFIGSLRAWTVGEEEGIGCLPARDKYFDMTEEEKDGKKASKSDRKRKIDEHSSSSKEFGPPDCFTESYTSKGETEKMSSTPSFGAHLVTMGPAGVSSHHFPGSQPASPVAALTLPHLLHFTAEEVAAAPGIEAETFPEMSFTESLPESHRSHISLKSSPRCPEIKPRAALQPAAKFSEEVMSNQCSGIGNVPLKASLKSDKHHKRAIPRPRKTRHHSPEATYSSHSHCTVRADSLKCKHLTPSPDREPRTPKARSNAAELDKSRKGCLSYSIPDFSKVEPKVHFPKSGYKPPKSRHSLKRESRSPEPPLVFKSPADIVKEVLLNVTDGSPPPSDSCTLPASAPDLTVPQEFRCPRHATALLEQLQEHYYTLLTKHAEAENTIDRLRLEAKVNLYSDPPKPGHLVQSGLNQEPTRVMMLNFPQAQRAEINSAFLHPNVHNTHQGSSSPHTRTPDPQLGLQPAKILYRQADKFLQQLQTFENLIKSEKLKPHEQVMGLSPLAEGLDSLERGYLLARDEHRLLQQRGAQISHFDPERELEGLIFHCGLRMDELKEQVEQMQQEQPICEPPPSVPLHFTSSSVTSQGGETLSHPQSPPVPLMVDPREAAVMEVSSASEESDAEDEETLNSLYLKPLNDKHKCVEQDFATLTDHFQSFKELPKLLTHSQREGVPLSVAERTNNQPGDEEKEAQSQEKVNLEVQKSLLQRKTDHQDSPPAHMVKQQTSRSSPHSHRASSQSTTLPDHPPCSRRRLKGGKSHSSSLSSLGEISASEGRNSKLQPGSGRVLSQDGIISPETDSGFIGSESSRLTPAAASSPLHQRASESHTAIESNRGPQLTPDQSRTIRQRQRRRTFSCSPQCRVSQSEQSRADSGTSEFGLESDSSHTVSEDGQNDQYAESINSLHSSSQSSSPTARHHHGNSVRALTSSQVASRNEAMQMLQAEVTRLNETLESFRRKKKPPSSVRAEENYSPPNTSTPRIRPGEQWSDVSRGRRDRQAVNEAHESTLRPTARKRPPSAHRQKPQPNILIVSEPSTPQLQPLVSRSTQTAAAAPDSCRSHTKTVPSRTRPRQHPGVPVRVCETADEPDSRSLRAPLCPQCLPRHRGRPEGSLGGKRESTHPCCRHCPLCGCPERNRSTEPDCCRCSGSPTPTKHHRAQSPEEAVRNRPFAAEAPPRLLQCMPVCPQPLLLYSSPFHVSPGNNTGKSSEVRGNEEVRARTRRSLSVDKQSSVHRDLNKAIRATRHMKHTSGHMARSLAAGLHYQELLTQSCRY